MKISRIVFEKGLELCREEDDSFCLQSIRGLQPRKPLMELFERYSVRPILLASRHESGDEFTMLLPAKEKRILDVELSQLIQVAITSDIPSLHHFNLTYIIGAVIYHCKRLAEVYSEICRNFASFPIPEENKSDRQILGNQPEPYYELDALITAAIRSYDTARYIIWYFFGLSKGDTPASFSKTLKSCEDLPTKLKDRLEYSWTQFGEGAKEYRDCIHHYAPMARAIPYSIMERLENGAWATSTWIPDNPKIRSQKKFTYDLQIDALTYGWELTDEIVEVTRAIVDAVLRVK
jgi:hypothetical protein